MWFLLVSKLKEYREQHKLTKRIITYSLTITTLSILHALIQLRIRYLYFLFQNDYYVITNATKHWIHKFDEHGFIASFQHHTHHRKLTHKIKNGSLSENGTRYVGDGSWGVTEGACGPHRINTPQKDLFELMDTQEPNHIWLVTIKNNNKTNYTINYTVIDIDGKVIHNPIIPLI